MWCIGKITAEYRERMYALCDLYAQPYDPQEPVVCLDEKSTQLLASSRADLVARPGRGAKQDYEYVRHRGTLRSIVGLDKPASALVDRSIYELTHTKKSVPE